MSNQRKALSWSISILVHSALAFLLIKAGLHYALPEGDVVSIDINSGGNQGVQTTIKTDSQEVDVKAPLEKTAPAPEKSKPMAAVVLPPKQQETKTEEQPAPVPPPPEEHEESPVVAPVPPPPEEMKTEETPEPETGPPVVAPMEESTQEEQVAASPQEEEGQAEAAQEAAVAPGPVVANPEASGENAEAPPKFGTPGTSIEESRLTPKSGNKEVRYPWMARMKRQEGTVVIAAYVRKDGTISHAMIVKSSGHEALDKEVMETYPKWKFQPGPSGWVVKPYHFRLKK